MTIADVARLWREAGVSCIPIRANGQKRPALEWKEYQARIPLLGEISEWWANGHPYGIALICGAVSGNLEMTEIEGRVFDADRFEHLIQIIEELGATDIFHRLIHGYSQRSPSGGLHLLYRVADHPVPGNEKIALDESTLGPAGTLVTPVLAETRGEGGYVIGAPSPGTCHPSGKGWVLTNGNYGVLPVVSWADRCHLHFAIRAALDRSPKRQPLPEQKPERRAIVPIASSNELSPGDDFAMRTDWEDILYPAGWRLESHRGIERMWTRPGKDPRDGASASTDYEGKPGLYVWSTSAGLPTEEPLSKLFVYAHYNFAGDMSRAAQYLARNGFGFKPAPLPNLPNIDPAEPVSSGSPDYLANDHGNACYLRDQVRGRYLWLVEEKQFYTWDELVWRPDLKSTLEHRFTTFAEQKVQQARQEEDLKGEKRWISAGNTARIGGALSCLKALPGMAKLAMEMDPTRHLLNVANGILDLRTEELHPHEATYLMTQVTRAAYRPEATCPRFDRFVADVLPDSAMRGYVQRALGYSLLGDADQRAIFLVYGPSGTGKSTLMDTIREVLNDYAITAPAGTFKATREKGPTNDLHRLRGKRFIATSETADSTSFDEDLIKRLTGRDRVQSRALYQDYQEWVPQCCIWLATNHPPKFTSDDDAIWRRAKLIPFMTQFEGLREITDMARRFLYPEADGILNWLLVGLREYLRLGLNEPQQVEQAASDQRLQSDSVARFIDDRVCDGVLVLGSDRRIRANILHSMYVEWARQSGERPVANRRFANRLTSNFPELAQDRQEGYLYWTGIGQSPTSSVLGTFY